MITLILLLVVVPVNSFEGRLFEKKRPTNFQSTSPRKWTYKSPVFLGENQEFSIFWPKNRAFFPITTGTYKSISLDCQQFCRIFFSSHTTKKNNNTTQQQLKKRIYDRKEKRLSSSSSSSRGYARVHTQLLYFPKRERDRPTGVLFRVLLLRKE